MSVAAQGRGMSNPISYTFHVKTFHGKVVGGILATVGVIALVVPEAVLADGMVIGIVMIGLAAGVLLRTVRMAADKRPRMIVNDAGIWHRDWGLDVVPWNEIKRVYMRGPRFKITFCVELKDPERFVANLPAEERSRLRSSPFFRLPVLRLPPTALDATMEEVLKALKSGLET